MSDVQPEQPTEQPTPEANPQSVEVAGLIQRTVHELLAKLSNLRTHVVEAGGVATPEQIEEVHSAALQVQEATGVGPVPGHDPGVVPQNEPTPTEPTPTEDTTPENPPA